MISNREYTEFSGRAALYKVHSNSDNPVMIDVEAEELNSKWSWIQAQENRS